jgi:hypothetical protein
MNLDKALVMVAELPEGDCWRWPGLISTKGYGIVFHDGRQQKAHRVAYERLVGPIRSGVEPDHVCRNRACFNPMHLELVSHRENSLRGEGLPAKNARKTHCKHGHAFDQQNTRYYQRKNGVMMRVCRQCKLEETWRRRGKLPHGATSSVTE